MMVVGQLRIWASRSVLHNRVVVAVVGRWLVCCIIEWLDIEERLFHCVTL